MTELPPPLPPLPPPTQPLPEAARPLPPFGFANAFGAGWEVFVANWGMLTLATLAAGIIGLAASLFPYIGWALSLFAAPIASSLLFMGTRAARGERVRFEWLFTQLRPYWSLVLINLFYWLLGFGVLIALLINLGGMGLGAIVFRRGWGVAVGALCFSPVLIAAIVAAIYFHIRWYMAQFLVLDDPAGTLGPIDAMRRSWEWTRGRVLTIFLVLLVLGLINIAGFLMCLVGSILFTAPLSVAVTGAMFAMLAAERARTAIPLMPLPVENIAPPLP